MQSRILDFINSSSGGFERLAVEVFAFQFEHNAVYRAYCEQQKLTPANVRDWSQIPAVPTSGFREFTLTCFPVEEAVAEFHTSGTTQAKAGKHFFRTLELCDAAIRSSFATHLLPDAARLPMMILTPSPEEAPHSSLSHMTGEVAGDDAEFYVHGGELLAQKLARDLLEAQWAHQPVFLLGTAFAFVNFLDYCKKENLRIESAESSRAMETGGFKGRSREMSKTELYEQFQRWLGIPPSRVVNEYGMTELSSQFYDETLVVGHPSDLKAPLPWTRVLVIDPSTGREAALSERGLIRVYDLANLWSVLCMQTEDLGIARADGKFEVLGRATNAEVRGCSLNAETLLTR